MIDSEPADNFDDRPYKSPEPTDDDLAREEQQKERRSRGWKHALFIGGGAALLFGAGLTHYLEQEKIISNTTKLIIYALMIAGVAVAIVIHEGKIQARKRIKGVGLEELLDELELNGNDDPEE